MTVAHKLSEARFNHWPHATFIDADVVVRGLLSRTPRVPALAFALNKKVPSIRKRGHVVSVAQLRVPAAVVVV